MGRNDVIDEMNASCVCLRARLISRVLTGLYDEGLRPFGIGSAQFALLGVIFEIEPATRAEIGRFHHQDRSTLTRNLKLIFSSNWAEEVQEEIAGRRRPIVATKLGKKLLVDTAPAWRKAQGRTKALLGKGGVTAVTKIADSLQNS